MMRMTLKFLLVLLAAITVLLTAACGNEGPAEKAGAKVDQAIEKAEEKVEEATGSEGPVEQAGEAVDEAVETAGDKVETAGDKIEKATE